MNLRSVRLHRGLTALGCLAALGAAGCGGSTAGTAVPVSTTPSSTTSSPPASSSSAAPTEVDSVGGDAFRPLALTQTDLPTGFAEQKVTVAQALAAQQNALQGATVTPPGCGTVAPVNEQSAKNGLATAFAMSATQEVISEFLAPAGTPSLAALQATAAGCGSVTITVPAKGLNITGSVEIVPAPAVSADKTLGLRTTTTTVVAGSPPVKIVQINYLAEAKGTLVSINSKGGPSGKPVEPAVVDGVFAKAVQKVVAGR